MSYTTHETLLVFRIAGIPFAVPAQNVGSILMPPPHITHAPGSHRSTPGIFHHAQATYAVIDLHERFGSDMPLQGGGRMLLYEEGIRHLAFLVDEVVGLTRSEEGKWANLPHYLPRDIFPIGFLHQEEIILCSELPLLRDMHDVEPLRHHAEQLKQQQTAKTTTKETIQKTAASTAEKAAETPAKKPGEIPAGKAAEISAEKTTTKAENKSEIPATSEQTDTTRAAETKSATTVPSSTAADEPAANATPRHEEKPSGEKPSPTITGRPEQQTAEQVTEAKLPVHTEVPHQPKQTPPAQTRSTRPLPEKEKPTIAAKRPPSTTPASTPTYVATESESDNSGLWLLLLLLLLVALPLGYWLWPQPQPQSQYRPAPRSTLPSPQATAPVDREPTTPPEPLTPIEHTEELPMAAEEPPAVATAAPPPSIEHDGETPTTSEQPPLRIERDEEGTINLIIDRQAATQNTIPQLPQTEAVTATAETADGETMETQPPPEEQPVTKDVPAPPVKKEEILPPTGKPAPCKCTHIVVKGDTLWDIAERYTGNAFNYPDLARRSGIKNPHRIYPGDRVRIIIR